MHENRKELFETLFKSHFHQLYVHAYGWVYDRECARDIVHDSFCCLWERFEQYEDRNLLSLLYAFVRSRCCDHLRRCRAAENYVELRLTFPDVEPDDYDDYPERLLRVRRSIEGLPAQTRRIFMECVLNRKGYKEVAELFQISPLTVKTLVSRAYKKIRMDLIFCCLFCTPFSY
ncbi:MAG: sigma-70 family RNA polymerase sigma factor [Rikenellaceae bacterium]|jgi:RNA polymerase sigma-70 factor (ECF subfamily)|nr:sigma-70 family RNA polymerase sigma factor [Rikenellaceae bacterium]